MPKFLILLCAALCFAAGDLRAEDAPSPANQPAPVAPVTPAPAPPTAVAPVPAAKKEDEQDEAEVAAAQEKAKQGFMARLKAIADGARGLGASVETLDAANKRLAAATAENEALKAQVKDLNGQLDFAAQEVSRLNLSGAANTENPIAKAAHEKIQAGIGAAIQQVGIPRENLTVPKSDAAAPKLEGLALMDAMHKEAAAASN